MGITLFEDALNEQIYRLCNKLDLGLIPQAQYEVTLELIHQLVDKREKIRKIFNGQEQSAIKHG